MIAYITASQRSGSTLLDNLLASHPDVVSLGEVHHLKAYATGDRSLYNPDQPLTCTCGATVPQCAFWQAVEYESGSPLVDLRLHVSRWLNGRVGRDSFRLFDAVRKVSGATCIVDSSKSPRRLLLIWRHRPGQVKTIVLCRDYRAVTHSRMKRGRTLEASITGWTNQQREIERLTKGMEVLRLRYEDLCAAPPATMQKVFSFLGLPPADISRPCIETMHHLGGSPSKREHRDIKLDTSYLGAFTAEQLTRLRQVAGTYATQLGYE